MIRSFILHSHNFASSPDSESVPPHSLQLDDAIYDIDLLTPEGTVTFTMAKDRTNNTVTFQKAKITRSPDSALALNNSQSSLDGEFQYPAEVDSAYRKLAQSTTHRIIVGKHITLIDARNQTKVLLKNHTEDVRCVTMTNKRFFTG